MGKKNKRHTQAAAPLGAARKRYNREGGAAGTNTRSRPASAGDAAAAAKRRQHAFLRWLDDYEAVSEAIYSHGDLEELLDAHGGLVKIENFLPAAAAEGLLGLLRSLPDSVWNDTSASRDYTHNNISHAFGSVKEASGDLGKVFRMMSLLLPESLHTFSAAKYTQGHHIEDHDDRAYTNVLMEDGEVVECSRRIAAILYLAPDWKEEWGGHLIDCKAGKVHVPTFNSLIAFRIPRYHAVTPVTGSQPRYTVFGWFLEPGRLYDLHLREDSKAEVGEAQEHQDGDEDEEEEEQQEEEEEEEEGEEARRAAGKQQLGREQAPKLQGQQQERQPQGQKRQRRRLRKPVGLARVGGGGAVGGYPQQLKHQGVQGAAAAGGKQPRQQQQQLQQERAKPSKRVLEQAGVEKKRKKLKTPKSAGKI